MKKLILLVTIFIGLSVQADKPNIVFYFIDYTLMQ